MTILQKFIIQTFAKPFFGYGLTGSIRKELPGLSQHLKIILRWHIELPIDSDDNLLFFEFPKEEGDNTFNVWIYNNGGHFVAQSSFRVKGYELEIKLSKMVFHDGYIYALVEKKEVDGVPLRVVRFELTAE